MYIYILDGCKLVVKGTSIAVCVHEGYGCRLLMKNVVSSMKWKVHCKTWPLVKSVARTKIKWKTDMEKNMANGMEDGKAQKTGLLTGKNGVDE